MTTNFKNIVFFALTKNDEGGEPICFKHLLEFHPEIKLVDLIFAGSSKCGICEPPILTEKEKDDTVNVLRMKILQLELEVEKRGKHEKILKEFATILTDYEMWFSENYKS